MGIGEKASARTNWKIETKTPAVNRALKEIHNGRSRKIYLPVVSKQGKLFISAWVLSGREENLL